MNEIRLNLIIDELLDTDKMDVTVLTPSEIEIHMPDTALGTEHGNLREKALKEVLSKRVNMKMILRLTGPDGCLGEVPFRFNIPELAASAIFNCVRNPDKSVGYRLDPLRPKEILASDDPLELMSTSTRLVEYHKFTRKHLIALDPAARQHVIDNTGGEWLERRLNQKDTKLEEISELWRMLPHYTPMYALWRVITDNPGKPYFQPKDFRETTYGDLSVRVMNGLSAFTKDTEGRYLVNHIKYRPTEIPIPPTYFKED